MKNTSQSPMTPQKSLRPMSQGTHCLQKHFLANPTLLKGLLSYHTIYEPFQHPNSMFFGRLNAQPFKLYIFKYT